MVEIYYYLKHLLGNPDPQSHVSIVEVFQKLTLRWDRALKRRPSMILKIHASPWDRVLFEAGPAYSALCYRPPKCVCMLKFALTAPFNRFKFAHTAPFKLVHMVPMYSIERSKILAITFNNPQLTHHSNTTGGEFESETAPQSRAFGRNGSSSLSVFYRLLIFRILMPHDSGWRYLSEKDPKNNGSSGGGHKIAIHALTVEKMLRVCWFFVR